MYKPLIFILRSVSYGLALAFVVLLIQSQSEDSTLIANLKRLWAEPPVSYSSAVRKAAPAVVNIISESFTVSANFNRPAQVAPQSLGSGVIIQSNGYIVTNRHVVANADRIIVLMQDGRRFTAELIGMDVLTDLALLHINAIDLPIIPQNPNHRPEVGDVVLAIGNPLNLGLTITQGIIGATKKTFTHHDDARTTDLLQMDAAINKGNSGGALVNSNGTLVGINSLAFQTRGQNDANGISFAIPYATVHKITNKLLKDGRVIRGWLGVSGRPVNNKGEDVRSTVEAVDGIRLTSIDPRSPAHIGGLAKNDIIQKINGVQVTGIIHILGIVEDIPPGEKITFTIKRGKEVLQVDVTITESR
ncbi:MAG: trypsin-like peptidase domain-containing protein [Algicola sp.]|nr:trypsin-like peptidase domain-containing protein [Algicola sp.]